MFSELAQLLPPRMLKPSLIFFRNFVQAKTLHGMQVYEWTGNNFQKLLKESTDNGNRWVTILFGIAFSCNPIVRMTNQI